MSVLVNICFLGNSFLKFFSSSSFKLALVSVYCPRIRSKNHLVLDMGAISSLLSFSNFTRYSSPESKSESLMLVWLLAHFEIELTISEYFSLFFTTLTFICTNTLLRSQSVAQAIDAVVCPPFTICQSFSLVIY